MTPFSRTSLARLKMTQAAEERCICPSRNTYDQNHTALRMDPQSQKRAMRGTCKAPSAHEPHMRLAAMTNNKRQGGSAHAGFATSLERERGSCSPSRTWIPYGNVRELGDAGGSLGKRRLFSIITYIYIYICSPFLLYTSLSLYIYTYLYIYNYI